MLLVRELEQSSLFFSFGGSNHDSIFLRTVSYDERTQVSVFFCQFYDVAKMAMIHRKI
jgi:hypothetical protein